MKKVQFDLGKAKAGAKLVTRNGKSARIVCWDYNYENCPIIALTDEGHGEVLRVYTYEGRQPFEGEDPHDLFILEESTIRPYANAEEILKDMKEHGPMVKYKDLNKNYVLFEFVNDEKVLIGGREYFYSELEMIFIWQDGHICGVEEGGEE